MGLPRVVRIMRRSLKILERLTVQFGLSQRAAAFIAIARRNARIHRCPSLSGVITNQK